MITEVKILSSGFCTHPEWIVLKGGKFKSRKFPANYALIRHSNHGCILFDTGYSDKFYEETSRFPFKIYSAVTPVTIGDQIKYVAPQDIKYIIISHFHPDHIGRLKDYPNARFIYFKSCYDKIKNKKGFSALLAGFIKGFIPDDFESRSIYIEEIAKMYSGDVIRPFITGYDIFGDSTIIAVELPGHVSGQTGIFVSGYFLASDACWMSASYKNLICPHIMASLIIDDWSSYKATIDKLHLLSVIKPDIKIILSHEEAEGL